MGDNYISPAEFARRMRKIGDFDSGERYRTAIDLMLYVLRQMGFGEGADVFKEMSATFK